ATSRRMQKLLDALAAMKVQELRDPGPARSREGWERLAEVIRSDRPLPASESMAFHAHLEKVGAGPARELWAAVQAPPPLLDLGGGTGTYAKAYPGPSTVVDRPGVGELAVDLLSGIYPGDQGTALLCNVLHLFAA